MNPETTELSIKPSKAEQQNRRIMAKIRTHEEIIRNLYKKLTPTLDTSKNPDDNDLKVEPVWRADLATTADILIDAMNQNLKPYEDHGGTEFSWESYVKAVDNGCLSDYDGYADLLIDGMASDNAILYIGYECLVIFDKYMIPFKRIPEVFKNHEIRVIWFNK